MAIFVNTLNNTPIVSARAEADINGNNIGSTYATKAELSAKQDALTAGAGIGIDANSTVSVETSTLTAIQINALKSALGVDETVLWTGFSYLSANPSLTLSENASNFKFIDIYALPHSSNSIEEVTRLHTDSMTGTTESSFTCIGHAGGGGFRINNVKLNIQGTSLSLSEQKMTSIMGTTVTTGDCMSVITKIVGIHRVNGGA